MRRLGVLAFALVASCSRRADPPAPAPNPVAPLAAELAGCAAVVRTACALADDRKVRVFVPATSERVEVTAAGKAIAAGAPDKVPGGQLLTVRVPDGASSIDVALPEKHASCTFAFVPSPRPPWYAEAQALRQSGKLDEAEAKARAALGGQAPAERAMAQGILARVALRRGKIDDAASGLRAAIAEDERAGLVSDRADDSFALAFVLHQRARRYAEARRVLDGVGALEGYPEGRAREPLYRAQVAWASGDTRTATRLLGEARARAERIGAASIARAARQVQGMVACTAGTTRSCAEALREADRELARTPDVPPCEQAEVVISLGFAELEEAEVAGEYDPKRLGDDDARGLQILQGGCPDTYMRAVALEHIAMADVLRGDAVGAKGHIKEARTFAPEPRPGDAVMWAEIDARIAELEGAHRAALAGFDTARALAHGAALRTQEWRAVLGRARVLEATGRADDALAAYADAETILDDVVASVPFGEGRASAAADGAEGMRRAAALLVLRGRAGDDGDAEGDWKRSRASLDAAVLAREGKLAALRARLDDAMHVVSGAAKEVALAPLPTGETVLAYARLGAKREIHGFVAEGGRVRAFRASEVNRDAAPAALAHALLEPASAEIARASRLRVLTDDALAWIDVHALPFGDGPLVARAPVVYGVDVAGPGADAPAHPYALVVADPTGDLPSARAEGKSVAGAFGPGEVRTLVGHDATAAHVRDALLGASRFHYAGHGVFRGREGSESALPLAGGGALTIGDVLTLARSPAHVVLSGCEAGRQQTAAGEGAANMAEAFLIAGASTVVAPVRVVDDRIAGELASQLHSGADVDLATALARVQVRAAHERRTGWEVFRAFAR